MEVGAYIPRLDCTLMKCRRVGGSEVCPMWSCGGLAGCLLFIRLGSPSGKSWMMGYMKMFLLLINKNYSYNIKNSFCYNQNKY